MPECHCGGDCPDWFTCNMFTDKRNCPYIKEFKQKERKMISRGDLVKDRVTGFTGVVTSHSRYLYGCDRMTVPPRELDSGKVVDSVAFDVPDLVLLEASVIEATVAVAHSIRLGDKVQDTVTDLKGTAAGINTRLNGCVHVGVLPSQLKDGRCVDWDWIPASRLRKVAEQEQRPDARPPTRTGGPQPSERRGAHDMLRG